MAPGAQNQQQPTKNFRKWRFRGGDVCGVQRGVGEDQADGLG